MQLKRWNIRKNATRKEWEQHFAAHKDTQSIPTSLDVLDSTLPPVILGKSVASKKRAKRWASAGLVEPSAPQASGSRAPRYEAQPIPGSISNELSAALANIQPDVRDSFLNLADILHGREDVSVYNGPSSSNLSDHNYLSRDPLQDFLDTTGGCAQSLNSCLIPFHGVSPSATPSFQTSFIWQNLPDGSVSELADPRFENQMMFSSMLKDINFKQELPSVQLERKLRCKGIIPDTEPGRNILGGFAFKVVAGILSSKDQAMARQIHYTGPFLRQLGSQVPGENLALITGDQAFESNFIRALIYSLLNGLPGLDNVPMESILRCLRRFTVSKLLLDTLKQLPRYVSRPLADNIFRAAIEATDTKVVSQLLKCHLVAVNESVCIHDTKKYTPVERAAALRSPKLIKSLINAGADVNKSHDEFLNKTERMPGALGLLISEIIVHLRADDRSPMPSGSLEVLNLLITAGARVHPEMMIFGLGNRALEFNSVIFRNILPESHQEFFIVSLKMISSFNDRIATKFVGDVISLCQKAGCNQCRIKFIGDLKDVVIDAALAGKIELVQLLFDIFDWSSELPRIFIAAIKSESPALIDFVLSHGPDPDPPAMEIDRHKPVRLLTTPIAEAVRHGIADLIQKLEAGGSLDRLTEGDRFGAVVDAAAEAGNTAYMRKLLAHAVTSKQAYRHRGTALSSAILGDHQDITQMLLEAGATLECSGGSHDKPNSNPGSLSQKDAQTVRVLIASGARAFNIESTFAPPHKSRIAYILHEYPGFIHEFPDHEFHTTDVQNLVRDCITTDRIDVFKDVLTTSMLGEDSLNSCLEMAVTLGHYDLVGYLLDMGANPFDAYVLRAAIPDQPDLLRLLFHKERQRQTTPKCIGARILKTVMGNGAGNAEALDELIRTNSINFVRLETALGREDSSDRDEWFLRFTPLGLAIKGVPGKFDTNMVAMKKFLEAGADPNGISKWDKKWTKGSPLMTALMVAIKTGREDAVNMLLDYGADVNARPLIRTTRTALQFAAELGDADMVRLLLSRGADVNSSAPSHGGATALQFAAMSGNCNIAAYLLDHGAQLGALPSRIDGMWPLEGAAANGRLDMIYFLWKINAREVMGGVFHDGFSERHCLRAMNFARENGHIGCRDFISELSGISVDRLETDEYGAPWIAYPNLDLS